MDQFAAQASGNHAGVVQVDGQCRVVFLHIRAEEQQRGAVEPVLDPRQITRVVMVGAVGTAAPSDDVAAMIEHGKGMAVLERAQAALLERDVCFDVKRRSLTPPPALAEAWSSS